MAGKTKRQRNIIKDIKEIFRRLRKLERNIVTGGGGSGGVDTFTDVFHVITAFPYNANGGGIINTSAAIQEAIDAAFADGGTVVIPDGTFLIGDVEMKDGVTVMGLGGNAIIKQHQDFSTAINFASSVSHARLVDLVIDGNGNNVTDTNGRPVVMSGDSNSIIGCDIYDGRDHCVYLDGATRSTVSNNHIYAVNGVAGFPGLACGRHGIALNDVDHIIISNNQINDTNQHAVGHEDSAASVITNVTIANNSVEHSGGSAGDGIGLYHNLNENIIVKGNVITGPGNHGIHIGGTNMQVIGNHFSNCGERGIHIQSDPNAGPTPRLGFIVSGNVVDGVTNLEAIRVGFTASGVVTGNDVFNADGDYGIRIVNSNNVTVSANTIGSPNILHGIQFAQSKSCIASDNIINETSNRGITFSDDGSILTQDCIAVGNTISNCSGSDIRIQDSATNIRVSDNQLLSATPISNTSANATTCRIGDNRTNESASVASSGTIVLPIGHKLVTVTGTTTITAITGTHHWDRQVTLLMASTAQITDGGSLLLEGNFTGAANRTITLHRSGSNWYEVTRSAT